MQFLPRSFCRLSLGRQTYQQPPLLLITNRTPALFNKKHTRSIFHTSSYRNGSSIFQRGSPARIRLQYIGLIALSVTGGGILYLRSISTEPDMHRIIDSAACIPSSAKPQTYFPIQSAPDTGLLSIIASMLRRYIFSPLRTGLRFLHLVIIFSPVIFTAPMLYVGVPESKHGGERWGAVWWYEMLTKSMQKAGPTFIKLAQWAASRRDLFSNELCNRLGSLHSTTKPHSLSHTISVVENVFSRPFVDVFESFDPTPIGSGAIAQVYRATLREDFLSESYLSEKRPTSSTLSKFPLPTNLPLPLPLSPDGSMPSHAPSAVVAVKVLHPHVGDMIRRDLSIMSFFAKALSLVPGVQWLSLEQEVSVFGGMMNEQLDLRHEAANLKRFEENFKDRRTAAVSFPRPLEEYTRHDLLVEEFQYAVPLGAFLRFGGGPYDKAISTMGLDAFLNMLLIDNFVHADLHPGNILVKFYKPTTSYLLRSIAATLFGGTPPVDPVRTSEAEAIVSNLLQMRKNGTRDQWSAELNRLQSEGYQPELVFLDAGLVTTLSGVNRRNFLELFRAIATFDGYRAGQLMISRSSSPELAIEPETFALKMQHLVLSVKAKTFSLGQIRISDVLSQVLRFVREHHVKMEGDFVNTVISVLLLEGIGRQLDPGMDLFKSALPILRQLGRQVTAREAIQDGVEGNTGAMIKFWVWLEARELINAAVINVDELIKVDWLSPNV
ncbi:hypothetical protein FRC14_002351 [Serendipita sp. 396]|nr:hypothetical protein FRC14_002351 [Serendipita sp. 396]KAG8828074.1 hypothetical protein FRC19_009930 [Serendipita sp. 401]KAG8875234.1 hypothetical protein FRC20_004159 [Serendipita sp. 405]